MLKSVYIDTTIPSYYVDEREHLRLHIDRTRQWWDDERRFYDVYTSELVVAELEEGHYPRQSAALALVGDIPRLAPVPEIEQIAGVYIANRLAPSVDVRDAFHLAFACSYKIDCLLTWNCRHLANARKLEHLRVINARMNLHTPAIITPLELLPEDADE
ncbi:MAG: hypothetical protein A2Z34_10555 [Planctomycetes bacterium RBG_16_59_8]|nr:MAG: hypothetical protein A2Z34_10555 [Planctomycetes bacterium RBG_16_59_8]